MTVTVLLTTYNHERYLAQALESVLFQQTNFDYGVVVLEDHSTDRTRDILAGYEQKYPGKVRLRLAERNLRSNKPFMQEFDATTAEFVAILDGDDYWTSPHKLQKQVDSLRHYPEWIMCFHNVLRIYEGSERPPLLHNDRGQKKTSTTEELWRGNFIAGCSAMFRRAAMVPLPAWLAEERIGDWPLYFFASEHGSIGYIDEVLGTYRIHPEGSWSKLTHIDKIEARIAFYRRMNANLQFRYDDTAQRYIAKYEKKLGTAKSIRELVDRFIPQGVNVLVLTMDDDEVPLFANRKVLVFPGRERRSVPRLFARGSEGELEAAWARQGTYRFALYGGTSDKLLLSWLTLDSGEVATVSNPARDGSAILAITPGRAGDARPTGSAPVIKWDTGNGGPGAVYVTDISQRMQVPPDSAAALAEFEELRAKGADFFVVPAEGFDLFGRYALKEHLETRYRLLHHEPDICFIYDLRTDAAEKQPAT